MVVIFFSVNSGFKTDTFVFYLLVLFVFTFCLFVFFSLPSFTVLIIVKSMLFVLNPS